MKNTLKVVPLFLLALALISCGPSGGAAGTPEEIGDGVKDAIVSLNLADVYGFLPAHRIEAAKGESEAMAWRTEEGYEKWDDDVMDDVIEENDPDGESGIKDEESWLAASPSVQYAFERGLYKLYDIEDLEDRLTDGMWYLAGREVKLDIEGQGEASIRYKNKYGDSITVSCVRENGLWAMSSVSVNIPKDTPEKPKKAEE